MATRSNSYRQEIEFFRPYSPSDHALNMTKRKLDSKGYFRIDRGEREHRHVWQEYHKACLLPWGHIHHKNGIRSDNEIGNLEGMSKREHSRIHFNPANNKGRHWKWKTHVSQRKMSEEHKRNISKALLGKPKSKEHIQKSWITRRAKYYRY